MKNSVDIEFTKNRSKHRARQFYAQKDWHKEFLESGAQFRMTFTEFKKQKQRKQRKKKG